MSLAKLFSLEISTRGDAVVLGDQAEAARHAQAFAGDPTGLEALVNHWHLEELFVGARLDRAGRRRAALRLGRRLAGVLAERLALRFGDRPFIFLLGGENDVVLRLMSIRTDAPPWFPYEDPRQRRRFRLLAFRAAGGTLEPLGA